MFDYHAAFSRNVGWVTAAEQEILRSKRIAIAGMGGVGGSHLLTLCRLGIGGFKIADFDVFEIQNLNRQAGAYVSNFNRPKVDVMADLALDINPELEITKFPVGVNDENLGQFLDGVDLYIDSLDFFALDIRRTVFAACEARGIPAVTAAPLGMGAALLIFMTGGMSFEKYFRMSGHSSEEQALRFMLGLAPARLQLPYLVDDTRVDFKAKKGPSTPMACELCAGFAGTVVLKILLHRGKVPIAPRGIHFDAYRNKLTTTWRPWGNNHPIQLLGLMVARKLVMGKVNRSQVTEAEFERPIERILDLARWAPSGDNEQPWRFEILDDYNLVVHASDTRNWCVYDLDGTSSQLAIGALLESIAIAASGEGMLTRISRRPNTPDTAMMIDVSLILAQGVAASHLLPFLKFRTTQRRPLATRELSPGQKHAMEQAVGEAYRVIWLEGLAKRWQTAKLLFHNAHMRLTTPEAYEVHRKNIEWGVRYSETHIPEHALGVDVVTRKIMKWALQSWDRVQVLNRFFAGTWLPRLQMDLLTGLRCGAHFAIIAKEPLETVDDYFEAGRAVQRFWLEATCQGLQLQPEMTPLIFSRYQNQALKFTGDAKALARSHALSEELNALLGGKQDVSRRVYMGRVGFGVAPKSRSIRSPLNSLLVKKVS
jgi:sulfur-carrier protein adenylyltransferase/sulfurtransferase